MSQVVKRSVIVLPGSVDAPAFHGVLGRVKGLLESKLDTEGELFSTLRIIMQEIKKAGVHGNKKELAENVLRQLILDADLDDAKENLLLNLVETGVVGNTIEMVVSASRGEMDLNDAAKGCLRVTLPRLLPNLLNLCIPKPRERPGTPELAPVKLEISEPLTESPLPDSPVITEDVSGNLEASILTTVNV